MKPLTNWPRKGSVLPELNYANLRWWDRNYELQDVLERFFDTAEEWQYRRFQDAMTDNYRDGVPNAGLSPGVVQAIQWMAGTPQFTGRGLQIVPMADEKLAELERWLEAQRNWRSEPIYYALPAECSFPHELMRDPWGKPPHPFE